MTVNMATRSSVVPPNTDAFPHTHQDPCPAENRPIADGTYVLLTSAATRIGTVVKRATRSEFNHVSIALVKDGRCAIYSFARRRYSAAFHSGMVKEGADRLTATLSSHTGSLAMKQVVGIDDEAVRHRVESMYSQASTFHYNLFDAVMSAFGRTFTIPDAFTCITFTTCALGLDSPHVNTISELTRTLPLRTALIGTAHSLENEAGLVVEPGEAEFWERVGILRSTILSCTSIALLAAQAMNPQRSESRR